MTEFTLVGQFVMITGEDFYQTGEVTAKISENLYMIKLDPVDLKTPSSSIMVPTMLMIGGVDPSGTVVSTYSFYSTRQELDSYTTWMNMPEDDKVEKKNKFKLMEFPGKKKD